MLNYTGHPLIDTGVAALTVMAGRRNPTELTMEDLHRVADELRDLYVEQDPITGWYRQGPLTRDLVWIYPNSGFVNPAFGEKRWAADPQGVSEKIREYTDRTLYAFLSEPAQGAGACSFCGRPSVWQVSRAQVPLLSGFCINFSPNGAIGVPICGYCLLAIHALPFGTRVVRGRRRLAVHCDDPAVMRRLVEEAVEEARRVVHLRHQATEQAAWPVMSWPRTRLVEALREVERQTPGVLRGSVTLYTFTNDNRDADLRIDRLTSPALAFLREAEHEAPHEPGRRAAWVRAVERGWQQPEQGEVVESGERKNQLYEDLYGLPEGARRFFRKHIWPTHNWALAALFLRKVMFMEKERLDLLFDLGTRLAEYALQRRRSFYYEFARERSYSTWRRRLLNAADDWSRQGRVLITADEFVRAFVPPADATYSDWGLARDIVTLRMIELLAQAGALPSGEEPLLPPDEIDEGEEHESED